MMHKSGEPGPVRAALERTIDALSDLGRLDVVDSALLGLCRSVAEEVDVSPGRSSLVKEYRECLVLLSGVGSEDGDALGELMAELAGAAVRDETPAEP